MNRGGIMPAAANPVRIGIAASLAFEAAPAAFPEQAGTTA